MNQADIYIHSAGGHNEGLQLQVDQQMGDLLQITTVQNLPKQAT